MITAGWVTIGVINEHVQMYKHFAYTAQQEPDETYTELEIHNAQKILESLLRDWEKIAMRIMEILPDVKSVQFCEDVEEYGQFGEVGESGKFRLFDEDFINTVERC
jgi:hypothetical protein